MLVNIGKQLFAETTGFSTVTHSVRLKILHDVALVRDDEKLLFAINACSAGYDGVLHFILTMHENSVVLIAVLL